LLELHGEDGNCLDNQSRRSEASFYRRRRNHQKRQASNLDGRIKPSFIRIFIDDENTSINSETIEYAKKYGIDIIVIDKSKYRKETRNNNNEKER